MQTFKTIDLNAMKKLATQKGSVVIIDARTKQWDDGHRIPGAISLPADTDPALFHLRLPPHQPLVIYCGGGVCPAARILAEKLINAGYSDVSEYAGGLKEWRDENNCPTEFYVVGERPNGNATCAI